MVLYVLRVVVAGCQFVFLLDVYDCLMCICFCLVSAFSGYFRIPRVVYVDYVWVLNFGGVACV